MSPFPMSMVAAADDDAARWQAWQHNCRINSDRSAVRARVGFALLLTATAAWLGLQLLSMAPA